MRGPARVTGPATQRNVMPHTSRPSRLRSREFRSLGAPDRRALANTSQEHERTPCLCVLLGAVT
eukprot:4366954-Alexandrium_andersonii.AAC.1